MTINFTEPEERVALREAVAKLAGKYGREYIEKQAAEGGKTTELWLEMGANGFLGVNIAEEYGGGGGGMSDLAAVLEEAAGQGAPLLMMVVSQAICGSIIGRYGTPEQKQRWLPGIADGSITMAFGITEADAGSNSHNITTTARRDGDGWVLTGQKTYISGVDEAQLVLIVARTEDARTGKLKPALFVVPTDAEGFGKQVIPMAWSAPEKQFTLFIDDVRLPGDALVGDEDAGLVQLFAGLNPERIMGAAFSCGMARFAIDRAVEYAKTRTVWKAPIGAHQGIAHPLAKAKIELEQARLLWQKAAALYDAGDDFGAGEYANMAKYAGGEIACNATDIAVHTHGGNGLTVEYGLANMMVAARLGRIAPVSREMILNFVAMHSLGLPKSY
ncbi:acyl-CoA dehydrogenase family protein [Nocardioides sp. zg-1228]|uniref:acyl-CoA dehydrogenase family protein n=1 Tax=Nocardioides sp. zg-1228 TaxID=2763008 RepID=UPI001642B02E|nr:acyl-CoA dehydrogenase family protein [Nocardioides sp. zg-1228]MBC2931917.1 acyl-CoA dehydrogenase family protein [Nocardioides sp. zg-1228]QSF57478.1 acyl-CoA dehydrogenase family protein [Nocardioides sp. zg-1228]